MADPGRFTSRTIPALLLGATALLTLQCGAPAPRAGRPRDHVDWHEDLAFLERELPRRHMDFFKSSTRESFHRRARELDARVSSMSYPQFVTSVLEMVAAAGPGNGHTYVFKTGDTTSDFFLSERNTPDAMSNLRVGGFGQLPIGFYLFRDGLYVRSVTTGYEELLGARVVRIGTAAAEDALVLASARVSKDNAQGAKADAPRLLTVPELLVGLGVTPDARSVPIEVQTGAGVVKRSLDRIALDTAATREMGPEDGLPLYLRHRDRVFWSQRIAEQRTDYVQWNAIRDSRDQPAEDFMRSAIDAFDRGPSTKLVLDLRFNPGGDTALTTPVLRAVIRSPKLQSRGTLFVVIGRETFSAAMNLCALLERFTPAVFVGEPTGGSRGFFGDNAPLTLPHTKLVIRVSNVWWQLLDSRGADSWIAPEIATELRAEDYAAGRDLALEAVFAYSKAIDYAAQIAAASEHGGTAGVRATLSAWKADDRARYQNLENALNAAAYAALRAGRAQDAIDVLTLAIELSPTAANLFDSRGEVNASLGKIEDALRDYRRALELDPRSSNAEAQVQKLSSPPPRP